MDPWSCSLCCSLRQSLLGHTDLGRAPAGFGLLPAAEVGFRTGPSGSGPGPVAMAVAGLPVDTRVD